MSSHLRGTHGGNVCGNKDALISYLYGECDGGERDALDAHLLTCLTCATELRSLRGVRSSLAEWQVPDVPLAIKIAERPASSRWWFPAWAQAAAAAIFVVAGVAGLANLEIRYGADGFVVRTGWTRGDTTAANRAATATATQAEMRKELAAAIDRLRGEFAAREGRVNVSADGARMTPARATTASDADVLRRVQALIDQTIEKSEQRQQRELALRMQQLARDVEINRRTDLARIEQSFGRMQLDTGAAIVSQRDWAKNYTDYVLRTSQRQPQ